MEDRVIKGLEEMAKDNPQMGMFVAALKFKKRVRESQDFPEKEMGKVAGSANDVGEHWPLVAAEEDDEYMEEYERYSDAYLKQRAEKSDG